MLAFQHHLPAEQTFAGHARTWREQIRGIESMMSARGMSTDLWRDEADMAVLGRDGRPLARF